jgi:hypothetical protein
MMKPPRLRQAATGLSFAAPALPDIRTRPMPPRATSLALVRAAALLLVALCLVPAGAHLSEPPNKIGLPAD